MPDQQITGRLATGLGLGRQFTGLAWARAQFTVRLGIDPYPGTVNLILDEPDQRAAWERLKATPGIRIENPGTGPHDCDARCYPVAIAGPDSISAAIVLPEVAGYPPAQIEVISAIAIRDALCLADGARIRLLIG